MKLFKHFTTQGFFIFGSFRYFHLILSQPIFFFFILVHVWECIVCFNLLSVAVGQAQSESM